MVLKKGENMDIPIYLFTGFLESGKTTFIKDTIQDESFSQGGKTLLLSCEEGEEEIDEDLLKECNTVMAIIDDEKELTDKLLSTLNKLHKPQQVIIEYNGTWKIDTVLERKLPRNWGWAEILTTVDASTFDAYLANMRAMMMEQVIESDVVIFNRCGDDTPKGNYRRTIKAVNKRAKLIYEKKDGTIDESEDEELPYDITADTLEICDDDYGIWYIDAMDKPQNYEGKTVSFTAIVYKSDELGKNAFVPGRFVMTCCAEDIAFFGFICKFDKTSSLKNKSWIHITAKIKCEEIDEYEEAGPVLYPIEIEAAQKPEDDLVYFN